MLTHYEEPTYHIREWEIDNIRPCCSMIVIGAPGSGKTTFMENIMYYNKHVYPVCRIFEGNESGYEDLKKKIPPMFISNYYDKDEHRQQMLRQKQCKMENGENYIGNFSIMIVDDPDDDKDYKNKLIKTNFKQGSRHYEEITVIGSQYAVDFSRAIRNATTYVVLFKAAGKDYLGTLWENFGGPFDNKTQFTDFLDALTGDYTCMVIDNRACLQGASIEECIYYYQTVPLGDWKFGADEFWAHDKDRRDKNYVEYATI